MLAGNSLKWTDPATWPPFVYVGIVLLLVGGVKPAWRWLQHRRAASWPTAEGHIESAEVIQPKTSPFSGPSSPNVAELGYSYSVAGSAKAGWYRRDFLTYEEAREFVRDLKGKPLAIHYNPDRPASSSLSEPALEMLLRSRAPALAVASYATGDSVSGWKRRLLWVFVWVSATGLVVSLWVHLGAVMGRRVAPEALFVILHLGIFAVWFPAVLTALSIAGRAKRRDFWKIVLKGSPAWMRYMVYGFMGYAFVNFTLFMPTRHESSNGTNPLVVWRGFSSGWMAFYFAAFAILYTAARAKQIGWRCPSGHSVPASARYCEVCGQPVIMRGLQG